ncbi:MAG: DUF1257 domain-containing protein [Gemmataceae bacterium]
MSHIVTVQTKVTDQHAITQACARLGLQQPEVGTAKLFEGEVSGTIIRFPGWMYPAVIDTGTGNVRFDNYAGAWGEQAELDRFLQAYAVAKATLEARSKGYAVAEQALEDGSIKLQITERA